ncbi:hypothetical protein NDI54_11535 [Haloarcula sp. S1AR25-5A]|uniref:Uncharacterized protein n=1 Tax=Haloarcula terrestris TaxID=2950533 RepID=A0AAE4EXN5_9EURY|nr:hypothetical protein [Haloarcula terrestris]MDS0221978.1 hypothetical protein [Haloarcula terrestris]
MSKVADAILNFEDTTPRVVADLGNVDFEVRHIRDDLKERYSDTDLDKAYKLIMANQVTGDDFKQLIGEAQYKAQSLIFDSIIVFVFPSDRYRAVFASFDYREDFPVVQLVQQVTEPNSAT